MAWRLVGAASLATLARCQATVSPIEPHHDTVVLRVPQGAPMVIDLSPDTTLFATGGGRLFRAETPGGDRWFTVAQTGVVVTHLFAASRTVVFALGRQCGTVFRWDESTGWRVVFTTVDSTQGTAGSCERFSALWGRNDHDVYVVGAGGNITHFDGATWTRLPNPDEPTRNPGRAWEASGLWSVDGSQSTTYVGGSDGLRREGSGPWTRIDTTAVNLPRGCGFTLLAARATDALFAWNACIVRVADGDVRAMFPQVPGVRTPLTAGRGQWDGSALFWTYSGDVVQVRRDRATVWQFDSLHVVTSAVSVRGSVLVAARLGADGVIVRAIH